MRLFVYRMFVHLLVCECFRLFSLVLVSTCLHVSLYEFVFRRALDSQLCILCVDSVFACVSVVYCIRGVISIFLFV